LTQRRECTLRKMFSLFFLFASHIKNDATCLIHQLDQFQVVDLASLFSHYTLHQRFIPPALYTCKASQKDIPVERSNIRRTRLHDCCSLIVVLGVTLCESAMSTNLSTYLFRRGNILVCITPAGNRPVIMLFLFREIVLYYESMIFYKTLT
jgi:hypothetical protein